MGRGHSENGIAEPSFPGPSVEELFLPLEIFRFSLWGKLWEAVTIDQTAVETHKTGQAGALVPSRTSCFRGWGGVPLSSPAHPSLSGRLPAPGAPIPGLRPSKLFQQLLHLHSFLSHEAPHPPQSCQPLAEAQFGVFDPGLMAKGLEGRAGEPPLPGQIAQGVLSASL